MSRNGIDPSLPPAICNILQNLSSRPNVESTLVLSRSDGTIICATGTLSQNKQNTSAGRPGSPELAKKSEAGEDQETTSETDGAVMPNKRVLNAAETLALSVSSFVHSATALGRAVGRSDGGHEGQDSAPTNHFETSSTKASHDRHQVEAVESSNKEDQVQLLRLRTKRQEIIIYPDNNYLCCVVQSIGKQTNGTT